MNDDIHSLIGAYAVDAVTDVERAIFEAHLEACAHCRTELSGLQETASMIGGAAAQQPPPGLRDAVLSQISNVRPLPPVVDDASTDQNPSDAPTEGDTGPTRLERRRRTKRRTARRWLAGAVAAAAIAVGAVTWHPWTGTSPTQVSAVAQVLHAADAHRTVKHLDGATATVVYSRKLDKSVLVTRDMAPAPSGHTYQIWYLTSAGKATSAGFVTPKAGTARQSVLLTGDANDAALVGVTVEPAGGSKQPTTKPIMAIPLKA